MPTSETPGVDPAAVDAIIAKLDDDVRRQVDAILHHPDFQRLERRWRGLFFVVERARFDEGVLVEMLNCSKTDLRSACERWPQQPDTSAVHQCALYRAVTSTDRDHLRPVATIVGDYEFDSGEDDLALLARCAEVAAELHAPFITAAGASFWRLADYRELTEIGDLFETVTRSKPFEAFKMFRRQDSVRYLAMVLPRFQLRPPYRADDAGDAYRHIERITNHEHHCWGNAAYALASRIAGSFADYGWAANIAGMDGGGCLSDNPQGSQSSAEVALSLQQAWGLAFAGLIGLKGKPGATPCFVEAASVAQPRSYENTPAGRRAQFEDHLGTLLPYSFIASRFAHSVRLFHHRDGDPTGRGTLAARTQSWLYQYVHDTGLATAESRAETPLRSADFEITRAPKGSKADRWSLRISPMFRYRGEPDPSLGVVSWFTLTVGGALR